MNEDDEIEFNIAFDDVTMAEADGLFKKVEHLLLRGDNFYGNRIAGPADWMVSTILTIDSIYGVAAFRLNCYYDGRVIIKGYESSGGTVHFNPDVQVLSEWAQQNGWRRPEPSISVVKSDLDFWKHYWSAKSVDSDYLEEMFGKRPTDEIDEVDEGSSERE